MAFQNSFIQLKGKIGNIIHYDVDGKGRSRTASKEHKLTEGTIKTSKEFGTASTAARLIRLGLTALISRMSDKKSTNQLNAKLREIIATGPGEKGTRQVVDGDLALLKGFQLNEHTRFDSLFGVSPVIFIDEMGSLNITLPEFETALVMRTRPARVSQAIIKVIVCILDFKAQNGKVATSEDLMIDLKDPVSGEATLELPLDILEDRVVVAGIGIFFKGDLGVSADKDYFAAEICHSCLVRDGKVVPFVYPEPAKPPVTEGETSMRRIAWKIKKRTSGGPETPPGNSATQ